MSIKIEYEDCDLLIDMIDKDLWITKLVGCKCGCGREVEASYGIPQQETKKISEMVNKALEDTPHD